MCVPKISLENYTSRHSFKLNYGEFHSAIIKILLYYIIKATGKFRIATIAIFTLVLFSKSLEMFTIKIIILLVRWHCVKLLGLIIIIGGIPNLELLLIKIKIKDKLIFSRQRQSLLYNIITVMGIFSFLINIFNYLPIIGL